MMDHRLIADPANSNDLEFRPVPKFIAEPVDMGMNAIEIGMDENELTELLSSLMTAEDASYQNNLKKFGYADPRSPSQIDIYPFDFESKAEILNILDAYNDRMLAEGNEEKVISYTDLVGTLMSSVTEILRCAFIIQGCLTSG